MIDWAKIAEPQDDGCDTDYIMGCAARRGFTFPGRIVTPPHFLGAEISGTLDFEPKIKNLVITPLDNDFAIQAEEYVSTWGVMRRQLEKLLTKVYPVKFEGTTVRRGTNWGGSYGTCNSTVSEKFGMVYSTVGSPLAFAEAMVASVANWKLYAMGQKLDTWENVLLENNFADKCEFPLRKNEIMPVGATIHAVYAISHMLQLHLSAWKAGYTSDETRFYIRQSKGRIEKGWAEMERTLTPTESGAAMFAALGARCHQLCTEAEGIA